MKIKNGIIEIPRDDGIKYEYYEISFVTNNIKKTGANLKVL